MNLRLLGLLTAIVIGSTGWAATDCLDNSGQALPIDNATVLGWKSSTHNGYHARGHVSGVISKLFRDATGHHHWEATIGDQSSGTIELIYDEAFGAVPTPAIGASVEACGDYITANGGHGASPDGALIHWIHASDSASHPGGFLIINGTEYGQQLPGGHFVGIEMIPEAISETISKYQTVTTGIFRGGRPTAKDLAQIVQQDGIHTDIDLENNGSAIAKEQSTAEQLGLSFLTTPLDPFSAPSDQDVNAVLAQLQDAKNFPIFIHCHYGEDRTGLLIGLYRVEVQKWTPAQAYQEMLDNGFHPGLKELDGYFRQRTGYN